MTDKVMSLHEAAGLVPPSDTLALGGMTLYRRPVAFVRELIRQGTGDLTLLTFTAGYESDLLVGAGLVRRVRTCYFGLEVFGLARMFTRLATAARSKSPRKPRPASPSGCGRLWLAWASCPARTGERRTSCGCAPT